MMPSDILTIVDKTARAKRIARQEALIFIVSEWWAIESDNIEARLGKTPPPLPKAHRVTHTKGVAKLFVIPGRIELAKTAEAQG